MYRKQLIFQCQYNDLFVDQICLSYGKTLPHIPETVFTIALKIRKFATFRSSLDLPRAYTHKHLLCYVFVNQVVVPHLQHVCQSHLCMNVLGIKGYSPGQQNTDVWTWSLLLDFFTHSRSCCQEWILCLVLHSHFLPPSAPNIHSSGNISLTKKPSRSSGSTFKWTTAMVFSLCN